MRRKGWVEPCGCAAGGVKLGLGCDLHGHGFLKSQGRELALRAELQPPLDVLRSATSVNAGIVQMEGRLGTIAPGALADLIAVDGAPEKGLAMFTRAEEAVALVMKGGRVVRSRV
jgi:imidazolonepropionase-like amidohydrolase